MHTNTIDAEPIADDEPVVSSQDYRDVLGHFASGLTIISGQVGGAPVGFTCQAFYSVSEAPPLVSFSVMETSTSWPRIRETGRFAINLLAADQHTTAMAFARSGADKWAGVDWEPSGGGNPLIRGALSWIDCTVYDERQVGDHFVVVGHVRELKRAEAGVPLVYYRGDFHSLA